ncbi:aspartate carbamoyltransferase [Candidatus Parcubacteria bacterium]|nr:MAG: aspartate carbamoyltransferase [Candidatus Parcubacteria bacterium]
MSNKSIIYAQDLKKEEIAKIIETAKKFKRKTQAKLLDNKIIATLFFEPSTRTRLSFQAAAKRLGGQTIGFDNTETTSLRKGESFEDTIRMVQAYCDLIVIRHYEEGAAERACRVSHVPVINAGDGSNQHPTQMLTDLFTIAESQKNFNKLNVGLIGDLKYGRTVHSLAIALAKLGTTMHFVSPKNLGIPFYIKKELSYYNADFREHGNLTSLINKLDILYVTRIQKERFSDIGDYEKVKDDYILKLKNFKNVKKNLKILHPLPRVNELPEDFDSTPYAYYFQQAQNGLYVREALLALILGAVK